MGQFLTDIQVCEVLYPGMQFHNQVCSYEPGHETALFALIFFASCETTHTQVKALEETNLYLQ
jgi:hypothetical protein